MYVWTDTAPAKIINLNNCVSIEVDEESSELYAIGNDGTRYFLYRFEPENDDDPRQAINAIRAIYEYLEEGRLAIDMSDIEHELRGGSIIEPDLPPDDSVGTDEDGRQPPKRLIVTVKGGRVIERESQRKTFVEAIEHAEIDKVHALRLGTRMHPLVTRKNTSDPPGKGRQSDTSGFYSIYVVYPAEDKAVHLRTISEKLGLQWKVEVIDR